MADFNQKEYQTIILYYPLNEVERSAEIFEIENIRIPVCNLDMLIKMKETVRDRDLRDLNFLKKKAEERKMK